MVSGQGNSALFHVPAAWWHTAAKTLVIAGAVVVAYLAFERYLRVAVTILLLAIMFTYLLQPVVEWTVRLGSGMNPHVVRTITVLLIYLALVAIIFGFGAAAVHKINKQKAELQAIWHNAGMHLPEKVKDLQRWYEINVPDNIRSQPQSARRA